MILITSGAFLSAEFTSLLGKMPPAFLPVGNRRLVEWQLDDLRDLDDRIVLTVPSEFQLDIHDAEALSAAGIGLLPVPTGMSLGQSIVYAINVEEAGAGPVRILHGDTLCGPVAAFGDDMVLAGSTDEFYSWAEYEIDAHGRPRFWEGLPRGTSPRRVLSGYFAFSSGNALLRCISIADMDFISGLDLYGAERPLRVVHTDRWLDFGHVQTYFQSKARHTTERSFNRLEITPRWIEKSSEDDAKIHAEATWYETLPRQLLLATPHYLGRTIDAEGKTSYGLEYLYLNTLSELSVFGRLPIYSWSRIFDRCNEFLTAARALTYDAQTAGTPLARTADYADKTEARLSSFARATGFDLDAPTRYGAANLPSLSRIAEEISTLVPDSRAEDLGLLHGDFCFSNILYDFRSAQLKVIDPRGRDFNGKLTPWGDTRYDLAKLMHSVWGRYDLIVAQRYALSRTGATSFDLSFPDSGAERLEMERLFLNHPVAGHVASSDGMRAMTIQLFLSMLPLHADDPQRQAAFIANALRLYQQL